MAFVCSKPTLDSRVVRCMCVLPSRGELIPHRDPFTFESANGTHQPGLFWALWRPLPPASSSFNLALISSTHFKPQHSVMHAFLTAHSLARILSECKCCHLAILENSVDLLVKILYFFSWADVQEALRPCICCHCLLQVLAACWGSRDC